MLLLRKEYVLKKEYHLIRYARRAQFEKKSHLRLLKDKNFSFQCYQLTFKHLFLFLFLISWQKYITINYILVLEFLENAAKETFISNSN